MDSRFGFPASPCPLTLCLLAGFIPRPPPSFSLSLYTHPPTHTHADRQTDTAAPVAKPSGRGSAGQLARLSLSQRLEQEVGDKSRNVTLVGAASENSIKSPTEHTHTVQLYSADCKAVLYENTFHH